MSELMYVLCVDKVPFAVYDTKLDAEYIKNNIKEDSYFFGKEITITSAIYGNNKNKD